MIICPFCEKPLPEHGACCGEVGHGVEVPDCMTCSGRGLIGGHSGQTAESFSQDGQTCPDCEGEGFIRMQDCAMCAGTGQVPIIGSPEGSEPCDECNGAGLASVLK